MHVLVFVNYKSFNFLETHGKKINWIQNLYHFIASPLQNDVHGARYAGPVARTSYREQVATTKRLQNVWQTMW